MASKILNESDYKNIDIGCYGYSNYDTGWDKMCLSQHLRSWYEDANNFSYGWWTDKETALFLKLTKALYLTENNKHTYNWQILINEAEETIKRLQDIRSFPCHLAIKDIQTTINILKEDYSINCGQNHDRLP